jgi:glycosyltransferase involved in cell wall biosynthesis
MAGGYPRERTSLIVTVLNEVGTLEALMDSIARQTLAADEVVIVDGGSTDGTVDALQRWSAPLPLRVLEAPGSNIAQGRNRAIEASSGTLIAVTDGGVRLEPDWLQQLQAALTPAVDVVAGFFRPDPCTAFERALGATTLPALEDVKPASFLPSSRSVLLRRRAWERVGGYPEWLDYCEDLVFDLGLQRAGCRFGFAPRAIAWFRPRRSLTAFFRQYYLYARGDGKARLWPRRHAIRYAIYLALAAVLLRRSRLAWLVPIGVAAYTRRPYQRLDVSGLTALGALYAFSLPPLIRFAGDVAKMLGYPVGVCWRIRRAWTSRSSS